MSARNVTAEDEKQARRQTPQQWQVEARQKSRHDCDQCSKSYLHAEHLSRHRKSAHPARGADAKPHTCQFSGCGKSFARKDVLSKHETTHQAVGGRSARNPFIRGKRQRAEQGNECSAKRVRGSKATSLDSSDAAANVGISPESSAHHADHQVCYSDDLDVVDRHRQGGHTASQHGHLEETVADTSGPIQIDCLMNTPALLQQQPSASDLRLNNGNRMDFAGPPNGNASTDAQSQNSLARPNDSIVDELTCFDLGGSSWMFEANMGHDGYQIPSSFSSISQMLPDAEAALAWQPFPVGQAIKPQGAPHSLQADFDQEARTSHTARRNERVHDVADSSAWPHDYQPSCNRDPYIELSRFQLTKSRPCSACRDAEGIVVANDVVDVPFDLLAKQDRLDDWRDEYEDMSDGDQHGQPYVTEGTRHDLLTFIREACQHPWSRFELSGDTTCFLVAEEISVLLGYYFRYFHPHLPFLHVATFDPAKIDPLLLLVTVAIALIYVAKMDSDTVDAKAARHLSICFSELARLSIVKAVESNGRGFLKLSNTQTWLLQQTLGLGCGDKRMYQLAERNRGGIITFARRLGLLKARHRQREACLEEAREDVHHEWQEWIKDELRVRLAWGVYVYDQQYAALLGVSPMLVPAEMVAQLPCREKLWSARTAGEWATERHQTAALPSPTSQASPTTLHQTLALLMSSDSGGLSDNSAKPLPQLTRFSLSIIAVTLYRLLWDKSRLTLLLGNDNEREKWGKSCEHALLLPKQSVRPDSSEPKIVLAFDRISASLRQPRSATTTPWYTLSRSKRAKKSDGGDGVDDGGIHSAAPQERTLLSSLAVDVQILRQLSTIHFEGDVSLIETLQDLAGRQGLDSLAHTQADEKLAELVPALERDERWRKMVACACSVLPHTRSDGLAAGARHQSLLLVISLFHSALVLYAFVRYDNGAGRNCEVVSGKSDSLATLSSSEVQSAISDGVIDLTWSRRSLIRAWEKGAYIEQLSRRKYSIDNSPLKGLPICMGRDIVLRPSSSSQATPLQHQPPLHSRSAGDVLLSFADALDASPWGLAASFRDVLLRLHRRV